MAGIYLETETLNHNFEEYSYEKVLAELDLSDHANEQKGASVTDARDKANYINTQKQIKEYRGLLEKYHDEFPVLYRIYQHGLEGEDGKSVNYAFKPIDFRKPEVITEEQDIEDKDSQLELECTFQDGLKFAVSAVKYNGSEDKLFAGQISLDDDTIEKLNAENFKRIMDFCERCGFSTFGLKIPTHGGMIDAEEKIKELNALLEEYKKQVLDEREKTPSITKTGEDENGEPEYEDPNINIVYEGPVLSAPEAPSLDPDAPKAKAKEEMDLNKFLKGFREFIQKDLHKKPGLSYWEHSTRINGQKMTVFVLYDKEDRENDKNDGRVDPKKPHVHNYIFSYRLYVGQKDDGTFTFGYTTPNGKKMDDVMAGDFIGEIKKAGITHLNLKNLQNVDKMVWMLACAEKGIVPTGVSINKAKANKLIQAAKDKLNDQEFAIFERRFAEQLEKNAAEKGKDLPSDEVDLVKDLRNKAGSIETEEKFKNFRKSYDDELKNLINSTISQGIQNTKTGAADALAAVTTFARTFDILMADDKNMDATLGEHLDYLLHNPLRGKGDEGKSKGDVFLVRLTDQERNLLSALGANKKVKDLTKEDWRRAYNILFERQYKEAKENIIETYREDRRSTVHGLDNVLLNRIWGKALDQFRNVNNILESVGLKSLEMPEKKGDLSYKPPKELSWAYIKEQEKKKKAAEEAAKAEAEASKTTAKPEPTATPTPAPTHTPERSRD